jgi:hypothetical protein
MRTLARTYLTGRVEEHYGYDEPTAARLVDAYTAATRAYGRWLVCPAWRRRRRGALRIAAAELCANAARVRDRIGTTGPTTPLLVILDHDHDQHGRA